MSGSESSIRRGAALQAGRVAQWHEDKGYGWIESGGRRIFVHIRDFDRRPRGSPAGEDVSFRKGLDAMGRPCAKQVEIVRAAQPTAGGGVWLQVGVLLVLPAAALLRLPVPWWQAAAVPATLSAFTWSLYAHDKDQAVSRGWRVPESFLHMAELCGGWPGALLAQKLLRHKCSKRSYQWFFRAIVFLHQFAAGDFLLDWQFSRRFIAQFFPQ